MIEARDVQVRYRGGAMGTLGVSLRADAGSLVAVFGPNGAGKTTTVRALSGFMRTEGARIVAGSVVVGGVDWTNAEPHLMVRDGVSCVPERRKIFPTLTVTENLDVVAGQLARTERRRRLQVVHDVFPILRDRGRELAGRLSGGQQQMLAIGRALLPEPKALLIDEITLGLHVSFHGPIFEAVRRVADQGTAVVVTGESTHALDVADRVYVMAGGRVADEGPVERFRGSDLLMAGYVGTAS